MKTPKAKPLGKALDWKKPQALQATLGLVDNPYRAEQRLLNIDLTSDPLVVFGAAGRGKTTFLKSLVTSLAAEFSPADLHVFALDFGRGGHKALNALPHLGGIGDATEEERGGRVLG